MARHICSLEAYSIMQPQQLYQLPDNQYISTVNSQYFKKLFNNCNFYWFRVADVFWKYLAAVSARFTSSFIFGEMATGDRKRVAQISH